MCESKFILQFFFILIYNPLSYVGLCIQFYFEFRLFFLEFFLPSFFITLFYEKLFLAPQVKVFSKCACQRIYDLNWCILLITNLSHREQKEGEKKNVYICSYFYNIYLELLLDDKAKYQKKKLNLKKAHFN